MSIEVLLAVTRESYVTPRDKLQTRTCKRLFNVNDCHEGINFKSLSQNIWSICTVWYMPVIWFSTRNLNILSISYSELRVSFSLRLKYYLISALTMTHVQTQRMIIAFTKGIKTHSTLWITHLEITAMNDLRILTSY
jgi:hypothetical protein